MQAAALRGCYKHVNPIEFCKVPSCVLIEFKMFCSLSITIDIVNPLANLTTTCQTHSYNMVPT